MKLDLTAHTVKYTKDGILQRDEYKIGNYTVARTSISDEYVIINVTRNYKMRYLPDIIYFDEPFGNEHAEFKVQTTAYGAVTPNEVPQIIEGFEEAMEVAKVLNKRFGK